MRGEIAKSASLVDTIQKLEDKYRNKGLRTVVVYLQGQEASQTLKDFVAKRKLTIPVAYLAQGNSQPPANYRIHPEAQTTVLTHKGSVVKANFVNVTDKDLPKIAEAVEVLVK